MLKFKDLFIISLLSISVLGTSSSMAMEIPSFDLEGDGRFKPVIFPFNYYKKEENDRFTLIHQGGYKVYDLKENANDVAVIGTLRPCIGIAVTDCKNLVTFHKHSTNSLESMKNVMMENLDMEDRDNLYARIYTTGDDFEWNQTHRQLAHGGHSHIEEVKRIKESLENIGIIREQIPANLKPLRNNKTKKLINEEGALGRYELAELCVALRLNGLFTLEDGGKKQIKFSSIDPFTEDVFGYQGTQVTEAEQLGPNLSQYQEIYPGLDFSKRLVSYDLIPQEYMQTTGMKDGYRQQRGICERRLSREEESLYLTYFGKTSKQIANIGYNSVDFYPIN
jgi:hypothetical protein